MAMIEEKFCRDDSDCSNKQYCYHVSERCVDYTQCNRYNRVENHEGRSRHPSQCGPCFPGYIAEELGTGEMAIFCRKTDIRQNVRRLNTDVIIYPTIGIILISLLAFLGILLLKRRRSKQRKNIVEQCERGELCVMEPTAPPFENKPFITCKEGSPPITYNNNKILRDKNNLVRAVGYVPPCWVRTNPNYEYDSNNDDVDALRQLHSPELSTDDQSNNLTPEQLTLEVRNGSLAEYEIEQMDNNLNTILIQANDPSSSNSTQEENNNNNNDNGSTSESSNTQSGREHVRISNVLISQKISMNVNLLNSDC